MMHVEASRSFATIRGQLIVLRDYRSRVLINKGGVFSMRPCVLKKLSKNTAGFIEESHVACVYAIVRYVDPLFRFINPTARN